MITAVPRRTGFVISLAVTALMGACAQATAGTDASSPTATTTGTDAVTVARSATTLATTAPATATVTAGTMATAMTSGLVPASSSSSAGATPVTTANLVSASQMVFEQEHFVETATGPGAGQSADSLCLRRAPVGAAANASFTRTFDVRNGGDTVGHAAATVSSYDSHTRAAEAARAMAADFVGCAGRVSGSVSHTLRRVVLSDRTPATLFSVNYTNATGANAEESAVLVHGTHVEFITMTLKGVQAPVLVVEVQQTAQMATATL